MGTDVWLSLDLADRQPINLLAGLLDAVGSAAVDSTAVAHFDTAIEQLGEQSWSRAPDGIALILDDVHLLSGSASAQVLERLIDVLPENVHLVLASRPPLELNVARLRSRGELLELTAAELFFDEEELALLVDQRGVATAPDGLTSHPATADLTLRVGPSASHEYLWEEILAALPGERVAVLARLSLCDEVDDELALALSDGVYTAAAAVRDLPLIDRSESGSFRMHGLMREVLKGRLTSTDRLIALRIAAEIERQRREYVRAVYMFAAAGDEETALAVARESAFLPVLQLPVGDLVMLSVEIDRLRLGSSIAATAGCDLTVHYWCRSVDRQEVRLDAGIARIEHDEEMELLALHRGLQLRFSDIGDVPAADVERVEALAARLPFARGLAAQLRSQLLQAAGDSVGALEQLADLGPLVQAVEVTRAERLCDLGQPELVGFGISPADLAALPVGSEMFLAFAMWLRADAFSRVRQHVRRRHCCCAPTTPSGFGLRLASRGRSAHRVGLFRLRAGCVLRSRSEELDWGTGPPGASLCRDGHRLVSRGRR